MHSTGEPADHHSAGLWANQEAFSAFFLEWHAPVVYFILQITGDQPAAEDLAEDAFVSLWQRRSGFTHIKAAKSYLFTTARNSSLNWLESKQVANKNHKQLGYLMQHESASTLDVMIRTELVHELHLALQELPTQCRKVFNLLYQQGMSHQQVANELNLSINTVKAHRARGLALLRKKLSLLLFFL